MAALQRRFVALLRVIHGDQAEIVEEVAPAWLLRPGRAELGRRWDLARIVYWSLTGMVLPEVMPPRERRRLDVILTEPNGRMRTIEVDESQHFTGPRARTLEVYGDGVEVAFDVEAWRQRCEQRRGRAPGGGFARPSPPLFPGEGGRHRQRAFRDFLADVVPPEHGWLPTVRVSDLEVRRLLASDEPERQLRALWESKVASSMGQAGRPRD